MHVDMKGCLVVTDHFQRRVTVFSPEGEVIETYSVEDSINWPRYLDQLPSGEFIFVFEMPKEYRPGSGSSPLIHLFNDSFEHLTSFGRLDRLAPSEHSFMRHRIGFRPGNIAVGPNGDVVFASDLYEGKLFRFREQDGQWQLAQTLEGVVHELPAYTPVEVPNLADYEERPDYPDDVDLIHVRGKSFGARIHNQSKEVFFDSDGRIVHFTFIRDGDRRTFGAELFDQQGNLLGYEPIGTYTTTEDGRTIARFEIGWQDSEDRFYILDYREQPVVCVVTIDFEGAIDE